MHMLCANFGPIRRLDILEASQQGKRQALCFLRLETDRQEQQLMSTLGIGRFSGDLVVIVDLSTQNTTSAAKSTAPYFPDFPVEKNQQAEARDKPFNS